MKFGPVAVVDACGAILAHAEFVQDNQTVDLSKGTILTAAHIDVLAQGGVQTVTVARLEQGDLHEHALSQAASAKFSTASLFHGQSDRDPDRRLAAIGQGAKVAENAIGMVRNELG
jgi:hypothetical protein